MAGSGSDESARWRSVPGSILPYGRQTITDADVAAVTEVLRSDWLTQGPAVAEFERKVAEQCGAKHAVAVSNGTAALHVAMQSLGLKLGDRLWTSPNTFVASANCARYCGAEVDFVDIDSRTYNLSVDALTEKLETAEKEGTLPTVVVPVHFSGQPCQMSEIGKLADHYGFRVVEDAAHAVGADYSGSRIGDCTHSSLATFSFHPVKIFTTGEGGMVMTNDDALYERLSYFRTHAITRDKGLLENESHGPWYYEQIELGCNYRITDIQCALGSSQIERLSAIVEERRALASRYDELLADLPVVRPWQHPDARSAWHLYVIRIAGGAKTRRAVFDELRAAGIGVQVHYIPVHLQPYYRRLGFEPGDFPNAEAYYESAISLPMFHGLHPNDQRSVVDILKRLLG
jgi:UDP-4-amino-4,6-dideoxy-N-acetyl-beta-L-altrosamine transaminase